MVSETINARSVRQRIFGKARNFDAGLEKETLFIFYSPDQAITPPISRIPRFPPASIS
jgi:hypothetical protein